MSDPSVFAGCRNALARITPKWLSNRAGNNNGYILLWTIALLCDTMIQTGLEGLRASWPGKGTPDADPYIGQGRGLAQAPGESSLSFEARLRAWLQTWNNAASDDVLASQIQIYLGNTPTVRIVDRSGNWTTCNPDGSITRTKDVSWNWDGVSNPERAGMWSDIWIIVSPPPAAWVSYASTADANWVTAWQNKTISLGHAAPSPSAWNDILQLVSQWKGIHTYVRAIIWTTDATLFVPGSLGVAGNPDGTWGTWGKYVAGICVPSRTTVTGGGFVRYWEPETLN